MNKQSMVQEFMAHAGQDLPGQAMLPGKDVRILRLKLIAEELVELASASNIEVVINVDGTGYRSKVTQTVGNHEPLIIDAADAIADLLYVVYGTAVAWGIKIDPIFGEVHRSNMTKFIDGRLGPTGKWEKGPSYEPARIKEILDAAQNQ